MKLFGFPLICSEYHLSSDRAHLHEMGYKYYNLRLFCPFPVGKLIRMNKQINSGYFFLTFYYLFIICVSASSYSAVAKRKKNPHVACVLNYILMFASTEMCIIRLLPGTFFDLYAER